MIRKSRQAAESFRELDEGRQIASRVDEVVSISANVMDPASKDVTDTGSL